MSVEANHNYQTLDCDKIVQTVDRLSARINSRFADSGLYNASRQLRQIAAQAKQRSAQIARAYWSIRLTTAAVVLAILGATVGAMFLLETENEKIGLADFIQLLEAGINDVVLIGAAIFFLMSLEVRIKRRRALAAIHELRSIAHIIDMHQLTKDPERLRKGYVATTVSPTLSMKPYEIGRYLDYCSELLSLNGKVAAVYVQHFDDAVVIASANEVEQLCTGLSRKIWQKIMILQSPAHTESVSEDGES